MNATYFECKIRDRESEKLGIKENASYVLKKGNSKAAC
jgi:hypothetical protein